MNLKSIYTAAAVLIITFFAIACSTKKDNHEEESAATDEKEWKPMDEFHMVMAETFHPYKDSSNLDPAKSRAGELAASAETWAKAPLPEKVDNDEMKGKLEELKNETSAFVQTVSSGDDKAISDQLTKIHDLFHAIQEDWYGGGKEHSEH